MFLENRNRQFGHTGVAREDTSSMVNLGRSSCWPAIFVVRKEICGLAEVYASEGRKDLGVL